MRNQLAFTLLELSIVLVLTGLLAGFYVRISGSLGRTECYALTKTQMTGIVDAIERFSAKNNRFPIPAARNVGVEDPTYGREAVSVATVLAGGSISQLDQAGNVLFGALPFQALGIPVENAADCWGNKLSYAVTRDLIDSSKFLDQTTDGSIKIKTSASVNFLSNAAYVVFSHGEDGEGAVKNNYSGTGHGWCTYDATKPLKTENCEYPGSVPNAAHTATIIAAEFNDGKDGAANYFDDIVAYRGKSWRKGECDCKGPGPVNPFTAAPAHIWTVNPNCN